jgi:hypothetical protein
MALTLIPLLFAGTQAMAASVPPKFAVGGVTLGMTVNEAREAIKGFAPDLAIQELKMKRADGTGDFVAALAAVDGKRDEVIAVLFTQFGGKAYQLLRNRVYSRQEAPPGPATRSAIKDAYGLDVEHQNTGWVVQGRAEAAFDKNGAPSKSCLDFLSRNSQAILNDSQGEGLWPTNSFSNQCGIAVSVEIGPIRGVDTQGDDIAGSLHVKVIDVEKGYDDTVLAQAAAKEASAAAAKAKMDAAATNKPKL